MADELVNFNFPKTSSSIIKVMGVGGGGCNAVSHMYQEGIAGVDFILCNTDAQAMENSPVPVKIQLGVTLTEGRGAGNRPEMGEQAAKENYEDVKYVLEGSTKMLFIAAGMGGGTGTGAAPVIAELAKELGILTIAVVTIPSPAEGKKRYNQAMEGIEKLKEFVDSILVINNKKLQNIYGDLPARQAFKKADNIIATAVKGVAEIITVYGNINIDFTDVFTVMSESKVFIMGSGFATGESRAMDAVNQALESPLLDNNDILGANNILLNIISGKEEITMGEIGEIIDTLQDRAGQDADIIWGNGYDESMNNDICVTILATGFVSNSEDSDSIENSEERFELDDKELDINFLDEEETSTENDKSVISLEYHEPDPEKIAKQKAIKKARSKKKKNREVEVVEDKNVESWFQKSWNRMFDDGDQSLD
ncbi:MAG: cell division protein FtsZ, partial [Mariniphaga sp.]|nr:cell division protein FtsZ [Mariniphaga sp.]